jgi:hypothetical protein
MQAQGKADALQRLFLNKSLADQLKNGHLLVGPFDFSFALLREAHVPNIARRTLQSLRHANFSCPSSSTGFGPWFFSSNEIGMNPFFR